MPLTITALDPTLPTLLSEPLGLGDLLTPRPDALAELDRQLDVYAALGVTTLAERAGLSPGALRDAVGRLRDALPAAGSPVGTTDPSDHAPFVLVLDVDPNDAVPAMRRGGRHGVSVIDREEAATYRPIDGVVVPDGPAYLITDVDTGSDLCGVRPEDALGVVRARGRTPLTLGEGVALTIVRPDLLRPGRCYSLLASRAGNQRVPAVWISEGRPKLGWCWDRNPHTWLGAASAGARVAAGSVG